MHLLIAALESVLLVSTLCYFALMLTAIVLKDGRIWTIWRWNVIFGFVGTLGAWLAIRWSILTASQPDCAFPLTLGIFGLIALPRLGGAVTNVLLALHLRRLAQPPAPPQAGAFHRDDGGQP